MMPCWWWTERNFLSRRTSWLLPARTSGQAGTVSVEVHSLGVSTVWACPLCPLSGCVHCLGCRSASDWTNIIGPAVFSVQDQAELQPSKTRWLHVQDRAAGRLHGNHEADSGLHLQW